MLTIMEEVNVQLAEKCCLSFEKELDFQLMQSNPTQQMVIRIMHS